MAELKRCPECGGVATVIHMYDTYDRADFGWDAGCGRYRAGDGLHTKKMKVSVLPSVAVVVRCKDCKHSWEDLGGLTCSHGVCVDCNVLGDFYCSYGERKDGADAEG